MRLLRKVEDVPFLCHGCNCSIHHLSVCATYYAFVNAVDSYKNNKLNVVLLIRNAKVVGSTPIIGIS